ncbi:phospholipid-binding lipoprotein MlaA [Cupriavidus gilardii J11]|uniref:Phospholipid-binding lipoprotein MlaA n=1 Tax=Cupriavidus gilardii J11 TaxID=936133 RepID=A0A562B958_9BURK|nr:VacJ family lipoprotein [Cupriavidus gilardii]TWG81712.1 phospholipid-binding lipoprotein MlaA [Cupriavidus gilardii J11]
MPSTDPRRLILVAALCCAACATGPNADPRDPIEPFNRAMFTVNDKFDTYIAEPVAKGYQRVTPDPVRTAVTNAFNNLGDIGNALNNALQGKGVAAAESLMRVAINTVLGLGGLIDIASDAGLQRHPQDFGLTLGTWGVPSGPYLVLPFFGPSSVRDGTGLFADLWTDPVTYMDPAWRNSLFALNAVNTRANLLGATDLLEQAALDRYSFVREAYLQRRRYQLRGDESAGDLPDYGDPSDTGDSAGNARAGGAQAGSAVGTGSATADETPALPAAPVTAP